VLKIEDERSSVEERDPRVGMGAEWVLVGVRDGRRERAVGVVAVSASEGTTDSRLGEVGGRGLLILADQSNAARDCLR
jgi:hypothetical protein